MKLRLRRVFGPRVQPVNKILIYSKNISYNLEYLQGLQAKSAIFPVLKSNAYGHGLIQMTKILKKSKVPYLIVDSFPEYQIVKKYSKKKILVLGETNLKNYKKFKFSRATFCVYNIETIKYLAKLKRKIKIHIFLDTGMHREGVNQNELLNILEFLKNYPKITVEGVMSHLYAADDDKNRYISQQIETFKAMYHKIIDYGHNPLWRHIGNSAGLLKIQDDFFNAYRPGLALYGYNPLKQTDPYYSLAQKLKPALQILSQIVALHNITKGEGVSYNHTWIADEDTQVASIPFGYAEGLPRFASNKISFKHKKTYYPQIGSICMNFCSMEIPSMVAILDEIELVGFQGSNSLSSLAQSSDLLIYELLVGLDKNIRREIKNS